jgi:SAM-dependent methyltransferase
VGDPQSATVAAYEKYAAAYRDGSVALPDDVADLVRRYAAALGSGARVLEIGSGSGRDAAALEAAGLSVRRTDVTPAFVTLLRADGHDADVVDPLIDDLADPMRPGRAYDGVWASACLLHVAREDLPQVATRLGEATRVDGLMHAALKEGDGETWSTHGKVAAPRHFTFWREGPLRDLLEEAGWTVDEVDHFDGLRGDNWLNVLARRR